ncbi:MULTISPECIES: magnesium transporter [Spirosoma]|uniref:magnesium transporter n=1 Tax=Spirosoma TaxID=107 RepID=UPI00095FE98F|nr:MULTISPECIES: magnesium transporter [Spirosoma]MBN8823430.1 magnesium transporter [Spirosoma sp.]OJW71954.1 MAG: magnesium transporter [Spirosoma sp. 48-14]
MTFELTKEYLERIQSAIDAGDDALLRAEMEELFPADISGILDELESESAHYLLSLLDKSVGAEILANLDPAERTNLLKLFTSEELAPFINQMDSDDAVDLLNEQPIQVREEVMGLLEDREQARFILDLLHYEDGVAGSLMQKELIKINVNLTVNACIEEIRKQAEDVENVYAVYVVDDVGKLLGLVSLKKIVLARKNAKIADIYDEDVVFVETYRPVAEVAEVMQKYDLDAVPVVNVQQRLLGRITIDDVVDVITEQAEEDIQVISGLSGEVEEDDNVWQRSKVQLPWLVAGAVGSLLAATVINGFQSELGKVAALAAFIPIIGSTGGNVGIQTSSLILQSLTDSTGLSMTMAKRLLRTLLVAIINGLVVGLIAGTYTFIIGEPRLFFVVAISLLAVVLLASFMGTVTPLVLNRIGVNPAVASGPFITTANDLIGIGVYFLIAQGLLAEV